MIIFTGLRKYIITMVVCLTKYEYFQFQACTIVTTFPFRSSWALNTLIPFRSLTTFDTLHALSSSRSFSTLYTLHARRSNFAVFTLHTLGSSRSFFTLRTRYAPLTLLAVFTLYSSRTCCAYIPFIPLITFHTIYTTWCMELHPVSRVHIKTRFFCSIECSLCDIHRVMITFTGLRKYIITVVVCLTKYKYFQFQSCTISTTIPLRSSWALNTLITFQSLTTLDTLHTLGSSRSFTTLDTLHTLIPFRSFTTLDTLDTLHTLGSSRTFLTLRASNASVALFTLLAVFTLYSSCTCLAFFAFIPFITFHAICTMWCMELHPVSRVHIKTRFFCSMECSLCDIHRVVITFTGLRKYIITMVVCLTKYKYFQF